MLKTKVIRLLRSYSLIFVIFSKAHLSFAAVGDEGCRQKLLTQRHELKELQNIKVQDKDEAQRLDILRTSHYATKHQSVLRISQNDPSLYHLSVFVLSEIEQLEVHPKNYDLWLRFLASSNHEQLQHRIYEGLQAITLIKATGARLAFEPKEGFFPDAQAQKSMDLELSHPVHDKVLRYTEVKRIFAYHNVHRGALKSIVGKAIDIAPKVEDHVTLEGVIYIGAPHLFKSSDINPLAPASLDDFDKAAVDSYRYLRDKSSRGPIGLSTVYLIDLRLELFYKFSIRADEVIATQGSYPINTIFPYLR